MNKELDDLTYNKILQIAKEGETFFEKRMFDQALRHYYEALSLITNPKENWTASSWLYAAIGDAYFFKKDFHQALNAFLDANNCSDEIANPFINLRLGQCYFELNEWEKAEDCLLRAYMLEGKGIYEVENKKYLNYLQTKFDL